MGSLRTAEHLANATEIRCNATLGVPEIYGKSHGKPMDTSHLTDQTGVFLASPHELDKIHVGVLPMLPQRDGVPNMPFSGQSKSSSRRIKLWKPLFF